MIHKDKKTILLGCVYDNPNNRDPGGRGGVWSVNGISPTLRSFSGGGNYPMIVRKVTVGKDFNDKSNK